MTLIRLCLVSLLFTAFHAGAATIIVTSDGHYTVCETAACVAAELARVKAVAAERKLAAEKKQQK